MDTLSLLLRTELPRKVKQKDQPGDGAATISRFFVRGAYCFFHLARNCFTACSL